MNHYCTYFDRGYLAQGLAMWESLRRWQPQAVLWVLAMDENTTVALQSRVDSGLKVMPLGELLSADPALAEVRSTRPPREFIFTLTAAFCVHLLRRQPEASLLIYLDADLCFFSDPAPILRGIGAGSVLMVAHRYPPWHDDAEKYGRFNVGVLAFRHDTNGLACLDWWRERCLESCALEADGVHYGDQKYLDEWSRLFSGVIELNHPGVNLAPWNWVRHNITLRPEGVMVDGEPLVVFHFAQFRRVNGRWFDSGQLEYGIMPLRLRSRIYGEYWNALRSAEQKIRAHQSDYCLSSRGWRASLGPWHLAVLRLFWGQFWVKLGPWWFAGRLGLGQLSGRFMGWYRRRRRRGI